VCHEILTENLGMHRIAAKFVPRLLNDDQKQNRVDVSQELLDRANDDNFLKNIITGDETGCMGMMSKRKSNHHSGCQKLRRDQKKRAVRSHVKVMLTVFFYSEGVVHYVFLRSIIWKLCNVFVRQSGKKDLMRGGRIDGCSNMTMCSHIHRS